MPHLGTGVSRAYIYDRRGETELMELPSDTLQWGRVQNEASEAIVTLAGLDDRSLAALRRDLGKVQPYAYSCVIYRNNERAWEGPIRRIAHGRAGSTISAVDVLGWLRRRRVATAQAAVSATITSLLGLDVTRAFTPDNPNVLAHVVNAGGGPSTERDLATTGYYYDDLGTLTGSGGTITTIGRGILISHAGAPWGRTTELDLDAHVDSEVQIILDGDALITSAYGRSDDGLIDPATGNAVDPFYGLLDTVETAPATTVGRVRVANHALASGCPCPVQIDIPASSPLSPDTPIPLSALVAGTIVPVAANQGVRPVRGTATLIALTVAQTSAGEAVAISLGPVNAAAAA